MYKLQALVLIPIVKLSLHKLLSLYLVQPCQAPFSSELKRTFPFISAHKVNFPFPLSASKLSFAPVCVGIHLAKSDNVIPPRCIAQGNLSFLLPFSSGIRPRTTLALLADKPTCVEPPVLRRTLSSSTALSGGAHSRTDTLVACASTVCFTPLIFRPFAQLQPTQVCITAQA